MRFLSQLLSSVLGTLIALGIVVAFLFFFIFALALSADDTPRVQPGSVLVLTFDRPIPEIAADDPLTEAFSGRPSVDLPALLLAIRKAGADDRISGLWLRPHGVQASWATLQEIRAALLDFKKTGKPIIASSDDYAVSEPDYFLASVADSVFASPLAMFEFNGFYLNVEFYKNLLDRLNVDPQIVRAGKFKAAVEPFTRDNLSPENEQQLTAILQTIDDAFMRAVGESRGLAPERLRAVARDSALFSAPDALAAGLIDSLLFRDQVTDLYKRRLSLDSDDDLDLVDLAQYTRVPAREAGIETGDEGEIAVVYAVGAISSGESDFSANPLMGGDMVGAETFGRAMREARTSDRVKAVVVRVDSPGGSAPAADAMWREIKLTADQKPVLVSMGDVAASGGYWIATAADTIVAQPLTLTGSIGVFALLLDTGGLFENKLGITFDAVRTSPYADMFSGVRPLSADERTLLEGSIRHTYDAFLQKVADGRRLSVAQVDSLGQGRVWTGLQARQRGLVDVLGGLDTAVNLAARRAGLAEGTYRLRVLPRPKTFLERFNQSLTTTATQTWLRLRYSPAERAWMEQVRLLQEVTRDHGTVQARLPVNLTIR